jgi:hypothetical protein
VPLGIVTFLDRRAALAGEPFSDGSGLSILSDAVVLHSTTVNAVPSVRTKSHGVVLSFIYAA